MNFDEKYMEIMRNFHKVNHHSEAFDLYNLYSDFFQEYGGKIIFSTYENITRLPFDNLFSDYKDYCKSLFRTYNFVFYSQKIKKTYETGNFSVKIPIDASISYDLNFARFVENYMGKNFTKISKEDFNIGEKILRQFVIENSVSHDYVPYILENIYKKNVSLERMKKNIEIIIKLFNLNKDSALEIYNMKPKDEKEYIADCEDAIKFIEKTFNDENQRKDILEMHDIFYLILLKIIWINKTIKSSKQKVEALFEFMDKDLAAIPRMELFIGLEYFKNNNLRFFNKIKGDNYDNITNNVKNMSWDLILYRAFEKSYTQKISEGGDFFIPFFLTFDNGLRGIFDINRIKFLIFFEKKYPMQTFMEWNEKNESATYFNEYYYTDSAILNRQIRSNELIGDNFPLYIKRKIEQTEEKLGNILPI